MNDKVPTGYAGVRAAEHATLALTSLNACAFVFVSAGVVAHEAFKVPLLMGFGLLFLLVLLAVAHATPLARARRPSLSGLDEADVVSSADFRAILKLAPEFHKLVALVGLVGLVSAVALFGGITWTTGSVFEERHARGIALYVCSLAALLYPVLGALSRLPSSLEDRVAYLRRNDA